MKESSKQKRLQQVKRRNLWKTEDNSFSSDELAAFNVISAVGNSDELVPSEVPMELEEFEWPQKLCVLMKKARSGGSSEGDNEQQLQRIMPKTITLTLQLVDSNSSKGKANYVRKDDLMAVPSSGFLMPSRTGDNQLDLSQPPMSEGTMQDQNSQSSMPPSSEPAFNDGTGQGHWQEDDEDEENGSNGLTIALNESNQPQQGSQSPEPELEDELEEGDEGVAIAAAAVQDEEIDNDQEEEEEDNEPMEENYVKDEPLVREGKMEVEDV